MTPFDTPPPAYSPDALADIAARYYGLEGDITPLVSERDQNVRLRTEGGAYVLKVANAAEDDRFLAVQNAVLRHLAAVDDGLGVPRLVTSRSGADLVRHRGVRETNTVRLVSFLEGRLLSTVPKTPTLLAALGAFMGRLSAGLQGFGHPDAHRPDFLWNLDNAAACQDDITLIDDPDRRRLVAAVFERYHRLVRPRLPRLRAAVVHQDANDNNLIVAADDPARIVGIIDFGDLVFGRQINELAVTLAYALLEVPDILGAAQAVIGGYHRAFALQDDELAVLFDLMRLRLAMSVCISTRRARAYPDNDYLRISQKPAFDLLARLADITPDFATCVFRAAAGRPPVAAAAAIRDWMASAACRAVSPLPFDLNTAGRLCLGLRPGAPGMEHAADPHAYWQWLAGRMAAEGADYAIGLYGEDRSVYTADAFDGPAGRRSQHLGIDLFAPAGTPVRAVLPGTVLSVVDNAGAGDYGPTVMIEHRAGAAGPVFYTLYGHLARAVQVRPGQAVAAGSVIGTLGSAAVNGGWAPHVHFQIITDLLGLSGNFNGAGEPALWPVWSQICPDPNLLLGLAAESFSADPAPPADLAARRARVLGPSLSLSYRRNLNIVTGRGAYLIDHTGRAYLDCVNNIAHVGHAHPHVVAALARQAARLNTNTRYLHDGIIAYAERLTATLPGRLSVMYPVCSGSEANELALRLARCYTGHRETIVLDWAYHGNTGELVAISPYKFKRAGGFPKPDHVEVVPLPDPYRGPYRGGGRDSGAAYAKTVAAAVAAIDARTGHGPAAFIAESISGVGGQVVYPDGYLRQAYRAVRAGGGLCIADEVQCGFGRVGRHYWAFELQGVVPDIVVLGKPIGNGHPMAAVVTTPEIAQAFDNGMEYFNSFGGNPVSAAVGMAVMDVIENEDLPRRAAATGAALLARWREMQARSPLIGDVRGEGLFLGLELVRDPHTRTPAPEAATAIVNGLREDGVLLSTDGPDGNVLKFKPPMVFGAAEADLLCTRLEAALQRWVAGSRHDQRHPGQ